jgi:hypothetical protein
MDLETPFQGTSAASLQAPGPPDVKRPCSACEEAGNAAAAAAALGEHGAVRRTSSAALVLMMLGAGTLIGEASAPADLPPEPQTIFTVVATPVPTAAPTPAPTVTPEPTPAATEAATPAPMATETATATPQPTETATPEPAPTPTAKHVIVVALSGAAQTVAGDATAIDGYIGGDLAPFAALAALAPPAKAYVESLPAPCAKDAAPLYDPTRNPLLPLADCATAGLDTLAADFEDPAKAPAFAYVVPNTCHDGRDGDWCPDGGTGAGRAQRWLDEWIPKITGSKAFADGGVLAVVFDEGAAVTPALELGTDPHALARGLAGLLR